MGLSVLLRLLEPPGAPSRSLNPSVTVYLPGDTVTLMCSVPPGTHTGRRFQFSRDSGRTVSSGSSNKHALGLGDSGSYTCTYWIHPLPWRRRSQESQPVSILVTDPPSQPGLSMDPPAGVVNEGLPLNVTCTAPGDAGEQRFHFYKDGAEIVPGHSRFQISSTDPGISSVNTSVLTILNAGPSNIGEYTCRYKKNGSGRWVLSLGSRAVNITVSGINTGSFRLRDILLLATGGILLLAGTLAAVICCFMRKKRGQNLQESTKGSKGRECTSNLDPSHDNKGSKAMDAGADQREQGSEVTYVVIALSALEAHTNQSKTNAQPAEEEHVLYSEVVKKHVQKPDK